MKLFFLKLSLFMALVAILISLYLAVILYVVPNYMQFSYNGALQRKYDQLKRVEAPRIVVMGGSSSAFGLNLYLLEELTGLNVVNMGQHAALGIPFSCEVAVANARKDDIVVAAFEYEGLYDPDMDILTSGVSGVEIFADLPRRMQTAALLFLPAYTLNRLNYFSRYGIKKRKFEGGYQAKSFDERGQMVWLRDGTVLNDDDILRLRERFNMPMLPKPEVIAYLNDVGERLKKKGAALVMSYPPLLDAMPLCDDGGIRAYQEQCEEQLDFPVISDIGDYLFDKKYMYDHPYHCNSLGEEKRTVLLARDINAYRKALAGPL